MQTLSWVFGSSAHINHGVVNLSDGYTDKICYLAANTAVIYDKRLRRQVFLQVSLLARHGGVPGQLRAVLSHVPCQGLGWCPG